METLTLEQAYYIGELVGLVVVIISVIYLALQVRQNTEVSRLTAAQSFADVDNAFVSIINTSPTLAEILHRGSNDISILEGGERIQFEAFHDQVFISIQACYFQWQTGALDTRLWNTFKSASLDLLAHPGIRQWWESRLHWWDKEFIEYVNQVTSSAVAKPMHPGSAEV